MFRQKFVIPYTAILILTASVALAKRMPPKPVAPVISGGIKYSAEGDGRDQYIVASDVSKGNELWKIKIFHNHIKLWLEEDVQWVFITDLKLANNVLFIRDEESRCYSLELASKRVKKRQCWSIFAH